MFFITLARNFGFGTNAQAFEQWALTIDPQAIGKHRDNAFQVEAFFMGQAGLLDPQALAPDRIDDYFTRLQNEYAFLRHKFSLQPLVGNPWKFGRLRPQNFPHVRLSQLVQLYVERRTDFSRLLECTDVKSFRQFFRVSATLYWQQHYTFGEESTLGAKTLQTASLNLLIINTAAPLLFAYGRHLMNEDMAERAFTLLEALPPNVTTLPAAGSAPAFPWNMPPTARPLSVCASITATAKTACVAASAQPICAAGEASVLHNR